MYKTTFENFSINHQIVLFFTNSVMLIDFFVFKFSSSIYSLNEKEDAYNNPYHILTKRKALAVIKPNVIVTSKNLLYTSKI